MYKRGDVVLAPVPFKDKAEAKVRPVIILETFTDDCESCKITGTNRTEQLSGRWVLKDSDDGKAMGLDKDSFISIEDTIIVKMSYIHKKIGECLFIDELNPIE